MTFLTLCSLMIATGDIAHCPDLTERLSPDWYYTIARAAGWPDEHVDDAVSVAWCETRGYVLDHPEGGSVRGMFQIMPMWVEWGDKHHGLNADRLDPVQNARLAWLVFSEYDGYRWHDGQWACQPGWVEVGE